MIETWRWFGPKDPISIPEIKQTGATGIVSARHDVPVGLVWTTDAIQQRKREIEQPGDARSGLSWAVVESLPVSEAIKSQSGLIKQHLEAYKASLRNLAECGLETVCYNFMPLLDWTRTDLKYPLANGGHAMRFDLVDFAVFDCCLLRRKGAEEDYAADILDRAKDRFELLQEDDKRALIDTVVAGLPGANNRWSLDDVRAMLAIYAGMTPDTLRANLIDFLGEVVPTAQALGIRLCCHPDDPPFALLGLPRVMSTLGDYSQILSAVDHPANGVTFCTGSLGVDPEFDPVAFIKAVGPRIHFAHLRNTRRAGARDGRRHSFTEAEHLDGDTDMVASIRALLAEEGRRRDEARADHAIPFRPDHGHALLTDLERPTQPGYPLIGRLRGLAELRGVIKGCT